MRTTWRVELPQIVLIVAMFAAAAVVWPGAPSRIPMHWDFSGQVDGYGGKVEGLLGLPLLALGIYLLMRYLPNFDPGRANYPRFAGAYAALRIGILCLMAALYALVLVSVEKVPVDVSRIVPVLVGALFVLVGALMGKIRPNWFVGIRTPWTISSKVAWIRTHRLGGWLFLAVGMLFILTGALGFGRFGFIPIGAMLAMIVALFVYSYVVWRADPEKQPPAGTQPDDES